MDEWRERLRSVIAGWGLSPEDQAEMVDEMEQHLEQQQAELAPRIGDIAARERILVQVNDPALREASVRPRHRPALTVESSRSRASGWAAIVRDFRYGWRALARSPGTTVMGTLALALGIGLTTVMFTIIYALLLRGLPFDNPDRIAMVMEANPSHGEPELSVSMHDFFAYRAAQRSFETFGAWGPVTVNLSDDASPDRVQAARVTDDALGVTRVKPSLGRLLRAGDEVPGGELVVLLSHSLWRDRYASDPAVLGRAVRVNGQPATVVGVMPVGFAYPHDAKLWLPLRLDPGAAPWGTGTHVNGVARLRPNVSYEQANADLGAIAARIEREHKDPNDGVRAVVQPFIRATVPTTVSALLYAMFTAVGLVFLVACANVANLLLARAASRTKEVAVRVSLGASRLAIARQFLIEAVVLATVSAALGALIARGGIAAFHGALPEGQLPFWADFRLHPQVFLFIAATALVASFVSGILPAITAARSDVTEVMKDNSLGTSAPRSGRLGRGLVVFELVLSSALLVLAALTTRSVLNIRSVHPGFRSHAIMTGRVTLTIRDTAQQAAFFAGLETQLTQLPGAISASLSTNLPGSGWNEGLAAVEGRTYPRANVWPAVRQLAVTPDFFKTFDIHVQRGRAIVAGDRAGSFPVAVVNQRYVDRQFPGTDPLGHRINLTPRDSIAHWVTIVGVMPNLYASDPASVGAHNPWPSEVITSFNQSPNASASIAIRTTGEPGAVAQPLRALVASLDRDLPVYSLAPMDELLAQSMDHVRVFGGLFTVFGVAALLLASIGLYAVMAFSVSRREREMGIRMALGATAMDVVRLVFRTGAIQLLIGVPIGLMLGVAAAGAARLVLFGVEPSDPATIAIVVVTLALTGIAACAVPALRATRSDPVRSLRAE